GNLPNEQHNRCRVLERRMNANRRIGRARPAGDERHAWLSGQLRISVRHERRARLVERGDQPYHLARVVQRVEGGDVTLARHAECVVDALDKQLIDEYSGAGARGHLRGGAKATRQDSSARASYRIVLRGGRYRSRGYVSTASGRDKTSAENSIPEISASPQASSNV